MQPDDPLAGLRALHLPPETHSYWSDFGFAAAIGLVIACAAVIALRLLVRPRRSLRDSAVEAFAETKDLPLPERRAAQAAILRRVVRTVEGEEPARASGPKWGETLDRTFATDIFTGGDGKVFVDGLYARPDRAVAENETPELDHELGRLFAKLGR